MSRFDVELVGFDTEPDIEGLSRTFGLDEASARALAESAPRVVKRDVDEAVAEELFHALRAVGAKVQLHRQAPSSIAPPSGSAPPPAMAFAASDAALPLPDFDGGPAPAGSTPPPGSVRPPPASAVGLQPPGSIRPAGTAGSESPGAASTPADGDLGEDRGGFVGNLVGAYVWPFQRNLPVLLFGVALVTTLLGYVPILGSILASCVWVAMVFAATNHAAMGRSDLPTLGDAGGLYEMLLPGIRFLLAFYVPAFLLAAAWMAISGTAVVLDVATGGSGQRLAAVPIGLLAGFGLWVLYLPSSLILAAQGSGCLGGLNVVGGVMLIVREPVGYLLTYVTILPAVLMMVAASFAVGLVGNVPFVSAFVANALGLIPSLIFGRILGLFIWHHEHELGLS